MKALMITAPHSNTGKTTLTLGIIRALTKRGRKIAPFKVGPDYIDSTYQGRAAGVPARNLDLHLQGEDGAFENLQRAKGELAIVEGVMGYFDGLSNSYIHSCYDLSRKWKMPAVMVYRPQGEMFSMVPKLQGMKSFPESQLKAVILNMVSEKSYRMAKEIIEEYVGLPVLGYMPKDEALAIGSRHLGLLRPFEVSHIEEKMNMAAAHVEDHIDLDRLISLAEEMGQGNISPLQHRNIQIAIAKDEAFSFHYTANEEIFRELGEVVFFSPLHDKDLPEADLVVLGGGYPELYAKELSENLSMKKGIKEYVERKGFLFAYGGGLLYTATTLEGYPMVDIFPGEGRMTERLQHFGYAHVDWEENPLFGKQSLPVREFHRGVFSPQGVDPIGTLQKPGVEGTWKDGYVYKNALGCFAHFHALGWKQALDEMCQRISEQRGTICI